MGSIRSGVAVALLIALMPSLASADDGTEMLAGDERIDIIIPAAGVGGFVAPRVSYSREIFIASAELRWAHESGHGAMFRGAWGTTVWGEGYGVDIDYVYRVPVAGDRDLGLWFDAMVGPTIASLSHNESTLALGARAGGNISLSLDFRVRNFVLALGGQYRLLIATGPAIGGGPTGPEHVITATLGVGFTFY